MVQVNESVVVGGGTVLVLFLVAFFCLIFISAPPPKAKSAPPPAPLPPPEPEEEPEEEDGIKPGEAGRVLAMRPFGDGSYRSWVIYSQDGEEYDDFIDTPEPLPTHFVRGADGQYLPLGDQPIDLEVADQPLRPGTSTFGGMTPSPQVSRPCTSK